VPLPPPPPGPALELVEGRTTELGGLPIARLLPRRPRRTIGAWCFLDQMGPAAGTLAVGPHPHIGLQTVTWLLHGEVVHRDSLGVTQPIRPGQLNLMTAGHGVSHAEEGVASARVHGAQLWVAQPESTRHGEAAFEHHEDLPRAEVGDATVTVLVGDLAGQRSPARHDSPLVGAELRLRPGRTELALDPGFEHGIAVLDGRVEVEGTTVADAQLLHLGDGRASIELTASAPAVLLLLGGEPLGADLLMWWNFVARDPEEIGEARRAWEAGERFGSVDSVLARVPAPPA
jgi:redox-sensitive bicupin YhaK (pirin superfamily)